MTTLGAALKYREMGISVIPLTPNEKIPAVEWEKYQREIASEEQVLEWFTGNNYNIGIVTGEVSNLTVVDCDARETVEQVQAMLHGGSDVPVQVTPRGGRHFFFKYTKGFISKNIAKNIDIKTNGGQVVAYPSVKGDKRWSWIKGRSLFEIQAPDMTDVFKNLLLSMAAGFSKKYGAVEQAGGRVPVDTKDMFTGGRLDDDIFSVANTLTKGGFFPEQTQKVLEILVSHGNTLRMGRPTYTASEIKNKIESALSRSDRKEINLSQEVRDWVSVATGEFNIRDTIRDLRAFGSNEQKTVWSQLKKMVDEGILEYPGKRRGLYRVKETYFEEMDFDKVEGDVLNIAWPLEVERLYRCYPSSIAVLAGAPGSGKTCFCLNFLFKNVNHHKVTYLSSELGTMELKDRLSLFPYDSGVWGKARFIKVSSGFEDAVDPNGVNIIDYLEEYDEFWKIAYHMKRINDRLKNGTALIALQRPHGRAVAKGGEGTLEKPRIYLTMSQDFDSRLHKIQVLKAHNWKDSTENPIGKVRTFKIFKGSKIEPESDWTRERSEDPFENKNQRGRR